MASWRRKAHALFPELRHDVQRHQSSVYTVFFALLPMVREAHQRNDINMLQSIYGFAEWCFEQKANDLWNAAGVAFYEHLFDSHRTLWGEFVNWLSPPVVDACWGLWEWRLSSEELEEVRRLIAERSNSLYETARLKNRGDKSE